MAVSSSSETMVTRPLRPVVKRLMTHLPEAQQCVLWHWANRRACDARRREVRHVGEGEDAVTYSLRPFDQHRCIFVHVPKAAGVSVAMALFGNLAGGHDDASEYCRIFGRDFWRYFKFTFVRNPYTRLVSAYEFLRAGGHPAWPSNREFRDHVLSEYVDFQDFVLRWLKPNPRWPQHFRPQHKFLEVGGKLVMDFVGRVERIEEDFATVRQRLGVQAQLRRANETHHNRPPLARYYTSDAVQRRIQDVYAKDFELFGYSVRPEVEPSQGALVV